MKYRRSGYLVGECSKLAWDRASRGFEYSKIYIFSSKKIVVICCKELFKEENFIVFKT